MATERRKVDPILVSVLDSRFWSIIEEMGTAMVRTSRSIIFSEARDFITAIYTGDLKLVAQREYLAVLAGAGPIAMKYIAKAYEGDIHEGDIFIHNDPYNGGNHLPDTNLAKPVFYKGELVFWVATKGHLIDLGGRGVAGYDPTARTIWDDGLVIPACKLYIRGVLNRGIWDLIFRNNKLPELVSGDIACEVGSLRLGERRVLELIERYGVGTLHAAIDEIIAATEKDIRDRIRLIPDGVYYGESSLDDDGINRKKPITARVKITKQADEVTFDFSDSAPQVEGFANSSWANTVSSTHMALFYALPGGDVKRNEGAIRPIKIIAPEGTWLNPRFPAPLTTCTCSATEAVAEAIWKALSQAGRQYTAASFGRILVDCIIVFNPRTKRIVAGLDFLSVTWGGGGREGYDGWPKEGTVNSLGGLRYADPEVVELAWPVLHLNTDLVKDGEAAGQYIGGWATEYEQKYLADSVQCVLYGAGTQDYSAPSGLFGGHNARPNYMRIRRSGGTVEEIPVNSFFNYKAGDIKEMYVQEGGGFGDPLDRDPERVQENVRGELVSIERAKEVYGVVIDPATLEVDVEATRELREKSKKER